MAPGIAEGLPGEEDVLVVSEQQTEADQKREAEALRLR
jgi:hypothetical protein